MKPAQRNPPIFRPTSIQASIDGDVAEFGDYWVCSHCRVVPFELVACPKCGKPRTMADVGPASDGRQLTRCEWGMVALTIGILALALYGAWHVVVWLGGMFFAA